MGRYVETVENNPQSIVEKGLEGQTTDAVMEKPGGEADGKTFCFAVNIQKNE